MHDLIVGRGKRPGDGSGPDQPRAPVIARHLTVVGRVQGVNFRAAMREVAEHRGVAGWVSNRPDGTVEAWVEGRPEDVEAVMSWVSEGGPSAAEVVEVRLREVAPAPHEQFDIRS